MSEMSWQLRHPEYGLMRIDLEETTAREGWTGKYLDFKRSLFISTVNGTSRKLSYTDTDDSAYSLEFLRGHRDDGELRTDDGDDVGHPQTPKVDVAQGRSIGEQTGHRSSLATRTTSE